MARNMAKCTCCNLDFFVDTMVGTAMPNRGGRFAYMCPECARRNRYYHTSNNQLQGKAKKNEVGVGWELETSYTDDYARNILFEYGMIPTNDSSLHGVRTCEYVSGIQQGLNIGSKMCVTIESLIQEGHLNINDSCGTHFHVSVDSMKDEHGNMTYMGYIRRYYHSLFVPLATAMRNNPEKTKALFGRTFTGYARDIDQNSDPRNRYLFINVTNDSNIEFRLNRFTTAKQAQTVTKMEVEMVKCIVTNFCEHFQDGYEQIDARRYFRIVNGEKLPSKDAYRKHKAEVTANKLVKLFEKFANQL
jgi:hypothetical protein